MIDFIRWVGVVAVTIICVSVIGAGVYTLLWTRPKPRRAIPDQGYPRWWDQQEG